MELVVTAKSGGPFYLDTKMVMEQFQMKKDAAKLRMKEFEQLEDRYGEYAVIRDGGFLLVNTLAFTDFIKHRSRLKEKNLHKQVDKYDAKKVAKTLGWYDDV